MHTHFIGILSLLLYLTAGALLAARMSRRGTATRLPLRGLALASGFAAVALHAWALYPQLVTAEGLDLAFFNAVSLIGVITALILLLAALQRPLENLGVAVFPFAGLTLALMYAYAGASHLRTPGNWQLDLHILMSILAYSVLAIAAVQAVLLAVQDHQLHARRPGGLVRALPPLAVMESLLFQLIGIGFVLLSVALVTGIFFLEDIFAQHLVHKTILSFLAWFVFAVLLWGRWRFGWRGRKAIRWTLIGYVFLMLAYLGTKLVLELVLHTAA